MANYAKYLSIEDLVKNYENQIEGGVGDDLDPEDVLDEDRAELELGVQTELEHTDDPELALDIALDHEAETVAETGEYNYYTDHLRPMEEGMSKSASVPTALQMDELMLGRMITFPPTLFLIKYTLLKKVRTLLGSRRLHMNTPRVQTSSTSPRFSVAPTAYLKFGGQKPRTNR